MVISIRLLAFPRTKQVGFNMKVLKAFLTLMVALPVFGQISRTVRVDTLAELAALPLPSIDSKFSAIVKDVGLYTYSSASAATTNSSGVVVAPLVGSGRWLRVTPAQLGVNTGTSQLTNALEVFGTSWLSDTATVPKIVGGTQTTSDLIFQTTSGVGATGADMHFLLGNNGATEAMTILNSGSVGIGTTTPGSKLAVSFSGTDSLANGVNVVIPESTIGSARIGLTTDGPRQQAYIKFMKTVADVNRNGAIAFFTNGGSGSNNDTGDERMKINHDGNVGIGTTGSLAKLAVNGGVHVGGDSDPGDNNLLVDGTTTSTGALTVTLGNATVTNGSLLLGTAGNGLQIKEGSNARMGTSTLSGGTITVANTSAVTGDRIFIQRVSGTSAEFGHLSYSINTGVEFTITSTDAQDDSVVNWLIIKPTP